jgi:hypothetical protein
MVIVLGDFQSSTLSSFLIAFKSMIWDRGSQDHET